MTILNKNNKKYLEKELEYNEIFARNELMNLESEVDYENRAEYLILVPLKRVEALEKEIKLKERGNII